MCYVFLDHYDVAKQSLKFYNRSAVYAIIWWLWGGYKTKTEARRPKNEDPFKIVLKSLENRSNMILAWSRSGERWYLRFSTNLARGFVLYKTPPKVQNEDPLQNRLEIAWKKAQILFYTTSSKVMHQSFETPASPFKWLVHYWFGWSLQLLVTVHSSSLPRRKFGWDSASPPHYGTKNISSAG